MDSNNDDVVLALDVVPYLRLANNLLTGRAADEIEQLRKTQIPPDWQLVPQDMQYAPTHRCKICGAFWRLVEDGEGPPQTIASWSLISKICKPCCDNVPMGEQIEALQSYVPYVVPPKTDDTTRLEWFFGASDKLNWLTSFLEGVNAGWTMDQWRASIDSAIDGQPGQAPSKRALPADSPAVTVTLPDTEYVLYGCAAESTDGHVTFFPEVPSTHFREIMTKECLMTFYDLYRKQGIYYGDLDGNPGQLLLADV